MGIVDPAVFRQRAAAAAGADQGSWVPLLDKIASLPELEAAANVKQNKVDAPSVFKHKHDDGKITRRAKAGEAVEIAMTAQKQVRIMLERASVPKLPDADRAAFRRGAEVVAEEAARTALTATPETPFDGAYVVIDALVKTTWGGPARPGDTNQLAEQRAFDDYTREAILRLAETGTAYSEQSTGIKKLAGSVHPDRIDAVHRQLIAEGKLRPGQVDIKMLGMIKTGHFGARDPKLPPTGEPGTRSPADHQRDAATARHQAAHPAVVGRDIGAPELYTFDEVGKARYQADYRALLTDAKRTGHVLVDRPHVGEGAVDNEAGKPHHTDKGRVIVGDEPAHYQRARDNLELLLTAAEGLRAEGVWNPTLVITRYGHAAHATPHQAARMRALGIIAEVNIGSNVATGSLSQTDGVRGERAAQPRYDDHALPSLIYYGTASVLSTDGPGVMSTTLKTEYARAHELIEAVLSGRRGIRVTLADATVGGAVRGRDVPGRPGERELRIEELTAGERQRFLHAYEKLYADAEQYYLRRPKPGATSVAAPLGGRHHTTIATEHGLTARRGIATYVGSRAAVQAAAAAYRATGYRVTGDTAGAGVALMVVVESRDGAFTTTMISTTRGSVP